MNSLDVTKLHTTVMGVDRIKRNLGLASDDVVTWCKEAILSQTGPESIRRQGKNWYVECDGVVLTINAHSHTIITAHKAGK